MTLDICVFECFNNDEFVYHFNRLTNSNLKKPLDINKQIDIATGKEREELELFVKFVEYFVYSRLDVSND